MDSADRSLPLLSLLPLREKGRMRGYPAITLTLPSPVKGEGNESRRGSGFEKLQRLQNNTAKSNLSKKA